MTLIKLQSILIRTNTLWLLFAAFIVSSLLFGVIMSVYGFVFIDEYYDPEIIRSTIDAMTDEQKTAHIWGTATLDILYPCIYCPLFAGIFLKFFEKTGPGLCLFLLPLFVSDLIEGYVQVRVLQGSFELLLLKQFLTPLKLGLFLYACILALYAVVRATISRFKKL